jgi:predicted PurR-regulated permease PerM
VSVNPESGGGYASLRRFLSEDLIEVAIRVGLIALLLVVCLRIFAPFATLLLWGLILAVALYPLCRRVAGWLGGRGTLAAAIVVLIALLVIGVPSAVLGGLFAGHIHAGYEAVTSGAVTIPPPAASVADWPIVGGRLHAAWSSAATDLPAFIESLQPQIGNIARTVLGIAAATMGEIVLLIAAIFVAGAMMAYGEPGSAAVLRIVNRVVGQGRGERVYRLITSTIRSVAIGVVGVAFIQSLLLGIGFVFAGLPAPGIFAVIVLIVCIVQLPAALISLPAVAWIWWAGDLSTVAAVFWTVYLLLAGLLDNVLKPLLLARGVDAPMPVILIGALSGMAAAGLMGLFLGAVMLTLGYVLVMDWVAAGNTNLSPFVGLGDSGADGTSENHDAARDEAFRAGKIP